LSETKNYRYGFLNLVHKYLDRIPSNILNEVPSFLFDGEAEIRREAEKIILIYSDALPESINQCEEIKIWKMAQKLISSNLETDVISALEEEFERRDEDFIKRFVNSSPDELQFLFKIERFKIINSLKKILHFLNDIWDSLSLKQKEIIRVNFLTSKQNNDISEEAKF